MNDAVHMKPAGYAALAGKIRELIQQWLVAKKRKGGAKVQPAGKRAKLELASGGGSSLGSFRAVLVGTRGVGPTGRIAIRRAGEGRVPQPGGKL
jgi:hypothetical protein